MEGRPLPAHLALRQGTRAAHLRAEQTEVMRALMDGSLSVSAYRQLLDRQMAFFQSWEAHHARRLRALGSTAGWSYASRVTRLAQDLAVPATSGTSTPSSRYAEDDATFWGELYVIEGSALGGQVLLRRLQQQFPDQSHAFYAIGLEPQRPSWKSFQVMLDHALPTPAQHTAALHGAHAMFHHVQQTLEQVTV